MTNFPETLCNCDDACPRGSTRYYRILVTGVTDNLCFDCDELDGIYVADMLELSPVCGENIPFEETCGFVFLSLTITKSATCPLSKFAASFSGTSVTSPAIRATYELDGKETCLEERYILPFKEKLDDGECNYPAYVTVEPIPPSSLSALMDSDCFPVRPCPGVVKNFDLFPDSECGFQIACCCPTCGDDSPVIPGATCSDTPGCGTGCNVSLNVENGNVMVSFAMPNSGARSPALSFTINSQYGEHGAFGYGVSLLVGQRVTELDDHSALVHQCDGAVHLHLCKPSGPGTYIPPPDVTHTLTKNSDGTWTEKTGRGMTFDYTAQGVLRRLTNVCKERLTITSASPVSYITDPTGSRTTFSYDTNNTMTLT